MAQPQQPLFGLVPANRPVIVEPTECPAPMSFLYSIPTGRELKPFSHVVVFLLPGIELPPDAAAAIYLVTPAAVGQETKLRFLGGIGPGKESAIFKIGASQGNFVVLGISLEPAASVAERVTQLGMGGTNVARPSTQQQPSTLVLAQRIIKNAFNFLASFSGQSGQVEVVPLKAFEEWWRKFEAKVRTDPSFLERVDDK